MRRRRRAGEAAAEEMILRVGMMAQITQAVPPGAGPAMPIVTIQL